MAGPAVRAVRARCSQGMGKACKSAGDGYNTLRPSRPPLVAARSRQTGCRGRARGGDRKAGGVISLRKQVRGATVQGGDRRGHLSAVLGWKRAQCDGQPMLPDTRDAAAASRHEDVVGSLCVAAGIVLVAARADIGHSQHDHIALLKVAASVGETGPAPPVSPI